MLNQNIGQLFMFAAIIAIFYFVLYRPQAQQRKKHEQALLGIKKGDEVTTTGGVVGEVIFIKTMGAEGAATLEDRMTIKSGESRLIIERGKVIRITGVDTTKPASDATAKG